MLMCRRCHREVHHDEDLAALRGHIVHSDPAATPVLVSRHRWVRLTPGGSYEDVPERLARALVEYVEAIRDNRHLGAA